MPPFGSDRFTRTDGAGLVFAPPAWYWQRCFASGRGRAIGCRAVSFSVCARISASEERALPLSRFDVGAGLDDGAGRR
jgi:hypothetical protein